MSNNGTTVVLGWDGLDHTLLEEFGLEDGFGATLRPIETFKNEVIGKPHTREIWPSMITGLPPEKHGIYAATESDQVKWSNPLIAFASDIANYCIPHPVRSWIGRQLRSKGAEVERFGSDYYDRKGLQTVFDGRRSLPVAVPNYWTDRDERFGYMFDRGAQLSRWLDRDTEGWKPVETESQYAVESEMMNEAHRKIGALRCALQREYDLIFVWLGIIDTAGHVEPVAREPIQERMYRFASRATMNITDELSEGDTLLVVSDHGLRNGEHTMDATAAGDPGVVDQITSVFDVAPAINDVTPSSDPVDTPPVRPEYAGKRQGNRSDADQVQEKLEDLGYL